MALSRIFQSCQAVFHKEGDKKNGIDEKKAQ